eukprot:gb/GEZN01007490.1/.p1 GENE.gb/GEZN01007490.1/~~gb/GEZN01007490.1/.p1  ORF type:complete len:297 (+),score=45.59 gb/GEZN01007490.1/:84-974(+)
MEIIDNMDENVVPHFNKDDGSAASGKGKTSKGHGRTETVKRTPLSSRNVNVSDGQNHGGHIARTNAQGDIVIYSPAFILTKEAAVGSVGSTPIMAGLTAGATPIILEDVESADQDVPVAKLNFGQFRKRDLSSHGLTLTPLMATRSSRAQSTDGFAAPHATPVDGEMGGPSPAQEGSPGEGELLIGRHLLLTAIIPNNPFSSDSKVMTEPRASSSSLVGARRATEGSTLESPVHFSSQGLTPLVGSPQAEIARRFEQLEDKLAMQERQHAEERESFQGKIEQLIRQVERLNAKLSQ